LGWAQPQELQPPKKAQSWFKAGFIFIDQKIIATSQNYLQEEARKCVDYRAALKCENRISNG